MRSRRRGKKKKKKRFFDLKYSHVSQTRSPLISSNSLLLLFSPLPVPPPLSSASILLCEIRGEGLVLTCSPRWLSCPTPTRLV